MIRIFKIAAVSDSSPRNVIRDEVDKLGKISRDEISVLIAFVFTILLWIFRLQINKWTGLGLSNTGIAILGALIVFVIPSQKGNHSVLQWKDTQKMQWGILILFGGGLALANAFSQAGIVQLIGDYVQKEGFEAATATPFITGVMLFMTELMSNVALVNIFAPLISGVAEGLGVDFLELGIPVALASSCAFMLPISTPPNAIVYSSGYVKVMDMIKSGVLLNLLAVFLLVFLGLFWVGFVIH